MAEIGLYNLIVFMMRHVKRRFTWQFVIWGSVPNPFKTFTLRVVGLNYSSKCRGQSALYDEYSFQALPIIELEWDLDKSCPEFQNSYLTLSLDMFVYVRLDP